MGTTLTGTRISDTYDSLLKATDNGIITSSAKQITDGVGNNTPLYISTSRIGIGVSPTTAFQVSGNSKIGGDLTVTGNLLVEGTTTTVDTDTLSVKDPLIIVGNDNNTSDLVDLGFYGLYDTSGSQDLYAGLYRSASTTKFHLFKDLQEEPTTTVNTSGTGYTKADLVIGDLEAERGTFTDSIFVSPSLYVSDAILHTGDIDTKLEFLSDQIKFSTGGSFRLSINNSYSEFFTNVRFEDGIKAQFGDNQDLEIYHDGTNASFISNTNTTLPLQIFTDDLDIKSYSLQNNMIIANSGGAVQLYYGGSLKLSTSSTGIQVLGDLTATNGVHLADNVKASFGGSDDLEIYHNGTHSYIDNNTGDIIIRNDAADKGISFLADDGAGGSENYVYIDGGTFETKFYKDTKHLDSVKAYFGTGNDLEIYHNGTSASIRNNTGDILISALEADSNIKFYTDNGTGTTVSNLEISGSTGTVSLKYYGSQKLYTTSTGVSITGRISQLTDPSAAQDAATKAYVDLQVGNNNELSEVLANGNTTGGTDIAVSSGDDITFTSTSKAIFNSALEIYHDATNNVINGTSGNFYMSSAASLFFRTNLNQTALTLDTSQNATFAGYVKAPFFTSDGGRGFKQDGVVFGGTYSNGADANGANDLGSTTNQWRDIYISGDITSSAGGATFAGDITVNGGDITLGGTGRIQGIDTVSASTDAASKGYVDSQVGSNNELSEVLANGNTTGGTDIAITAGDKITNFTSTGIDDDATSTSLTIDSSGRVKTSEEFIATEGNRKGFRLIANYGNWEMIASTSANHLILHSESLNADYLTIKGTGVIQLNDYGSGSNTGTATQKLAVDSSGNITLFKIQKIMI